MISTEVVLELIQQRTFKYHIVHSGHVMFIINGFVFECIKKDVDYLVHLKVMHHPDSFDVSRPQYNWCNLPYTIRLKLKNRVEKAHRLWQQSVEKICDNKRPFRDIELNWGLVEPKPGEIIYPPVYNRRLK